jgi:cytosine/adenosine deaminase-related metal-dependent hydrolase
MRNRPTVHSVHIYENSLELVARLCAIISTTLTTGDSALIIANPEHREQLLRKLQDRGFDLRAHARDNRYIMLDAQETLATFMRQGKPNATLFRDTVGEILNEAYSAAGQQRKKLTVFGEMVSVLWQQGRHDAALELEQLWNEALSKRAFHLHCAYPSDSVLGDDQLAAIRDVHSHLVQ